MTVKKPLPLSLKELKVLEFIEEFTLAQGVAPSFQEIKGHFGFASFNSVQRYLKQLQDKNYLSIPGSNQKRALQVLNSARSISNSLADRPPSITTQSPFPTQKKGMSFSEGLSPPGEASLSLPLLGKVAAGLPIEALLHDEHISVPMSFVRNPSKTFALIVQGQSMVEDGILNGDVIFVQRQNFAHSGETVVAMVNNQATVKRFYLHTKSVIHSNPQSHAHPQVELRPANTTMKSLWYAPQAVDIQGVVVGLMRRF